MEKKIIIKNIVVSLSLQFVTIISGFVLPKIILTYFGSEVNGLVSSINQILNYVQLLEGGLSGVVMAALYKPLAENDSKKISGIINATRSFFKQIGCIYVVYIALVGFVYPILKQTGFSYLYSVALVWVLGLNLFIQYFFSLTYRILLNADRKVYFVSFTQILIITANLVGVCICAKLFGDILLIKLYSGLIFFVQPLLYGRYVKKSYKLNKRVPNDTVALKQRWDGFGINLAYFIHTNTDIVILTFFSSFSDISVYSVYFMVVSALKNIIISISSSIVPSFGKVWASGNMKEINDFFDQYEFGMSFITTLFFSCGIVLLTPFVGVYTIGINDANYCQWSFGIVLTLAEMVYCFREPYVSVTYASGQFKKVAKYAYVEAGLNIGISLLLIRSWGIIGVATGTLFSMIYRMFCHGYYLKNNILMRSVWKFFKCVCMFSIATFISCMIAKLICDLSVGSYFDWIILGIKVFCIVFGVTLVISYIGYRNQMMNIISGIIKKIKKTEKS